MLIEVTTIQMQQVEVDLLARLQQWRLPNEYTISRHHTG